MSLRQRRRFRRSAKGVFVVTLPEDERALLRALPHQLAGSLEAFDPSAEVPDPLRRLFPEAHPRDAALEADYAGRRRRELLAHHIETLDILERTADSTRLDASELEQWLDALNELRLALGAALGVTEEAREFDPDAPDYADWVCYHYLSFLQSELIDALAGELPPPHPGAGDDLPEDPWGEPLGGLRWDGTPLPDQPS